MLKRNVMANYAGQAWAALMGLAFVPVYIRYLGIEAYGLIGLFVMLQTCLVLLDMGLTPTLGREMARYTGGGHTPDSIRDLLRSSEWIVAGVAAAVALAIWAASHWLATEWLRTTDLAPSVVAEAFMVMGVVVALRFLEGLYRSAVVGLQRQVLLNIVVSTLATVRWVGAIAVLACISSTVSAFFLWQAAVSLVSIVAMSRITYRYVSRGTRAGRFSLAALRSVWRFAAGMLTIACLAVLLTQVDKILLSRILSLRDFSYYALAATVAGALYMLATPITQATYPRLCEQHTRGDAAGFARTYHDAAQLTSVVLASTGVVVALFSEMLMRLWTQDVELASNTAGLLALLTLGNMLHGFMGIPYHAQLAIGWTRLAIATNVVAIVVIVPAIVWSVPRFGAQGAAWAWLALTAGYVLVSMQAFFARLRQVGRYRWYWNDVTLPLLGASLVPLLLRWLVPHPGTALAQVAVLLLAAVGALAGAALCADRVRQRLHGFIGQGTAKAGP